MATLPLPEMVKEPVGKYPYFPTRQQLYIWRNWEMVPTARLAQVLRTDVAHVEMLAEGMGLRVPAQVNPAYEKRGYITVIRNNWHVLPYEQLMETLGWTREQLAYTLKEDDFLSVKLEEKPDVAPIYYQPLTDEEQAATQKLRGWYRTHLEALNQQNTAEDFDFMDRFSHTYRRVPGALKRAVNPDAGWGFCDRAHTEKTESYVALIRSEIQKGWGITLDGASHFIALEIQPDSAKKAESHSLSISKEGITVRAVDEEGLLQGLYYLLSLAELNGDFTFDETEITRDTCFDIRYVHSYCALFGDVLLEGTETSYPDSLLKEYARIGINGIWMHVVMYTLVEFPWEPSLSKNWERRLQGLSELVKRAGKYGIKIYLYFNEPRAMPMSFFQKYPQLLGHTDGKEGSLCTSLPEVQQYITDSITTICHAAPELGGFFTITASENRTHCYSHTGYPTCPRCSQRPIYEVIAENNVLIARAAKAVNPKIQVIAYTWAWGSVYGCDIDEKINLETLEQVAEIFAREDIRLLCVSEEGVTKNIGGVETSVIDYSISLVGPGQRAKGFWKVAKKHGVSTMAKVQFNNTWECPTVPYLPVLPLLTKHIEGLVDNKVDGLMLSWSLGGYPSMNLEILSRYYWDGGITPQTQMQILFGDAAPAVAEATKAFAKAMEEYPFHIVVAYKGPQYMGPSNPLFEHRTGLRATMTGLPYDDVEEWRAIFPVEVFEAQFGRMSSLWQAGFAALQQKVTQELCRQNPKLAEFMQVAQATLCLFQSSYQQIQYNRIRDLHDESKDEKERAMYRKRILELLDQELEIAKDMYGIMIHNSTVGYEAANHYFFNKRSVAEKILCCEYLKERFSR